MTEPAGTKKGETTLEAMDNVKSEVDEGELDDETILDETSVHFFMSCLVVFDL